MAAALNKVLAPIQEAYQASPEWQEIALKAYPPPIVEKKQKKIKNKGTKHPGPKGDNLEIRPSKQETADENPE